MWITINCGKILKEVGIPDHLTYLLRSLPAGQEETELDMEQWTGSKLGKEYVKAVYCHLVYLYAEYIVQNAGLHEIQAGIKIAGRNINNLRYADDTTVIADNKEKLKSILMKVKEKIDELKVNIQMTQFIVSIAIISWQIYGETMETVKDFVLGGLQNHFW